MSQAVRYSSASDIIVLAGQVARENSLDVATQTAQTLEAIDDVLAEAGCDKSNMISATIWLADISDYNEMNKVWDSWIVPEHAPARVCVEAKLADPALRVEIQVTAIAR